MKQIKIDTTSKDITVTHGNSAIKLATNKHFSIYNVKTKAIIVGKPK